MEMATIVKPEFSDPPEDVQNGGTSPKKGPSRLLAESQAAVINTAGLITEDGLKHSESFDLPPNISLHQLARDGNEDLTLKYLEKLSKDNSSIRKRVNQRDEEGNSPLHYAARYNHLGMCRVLVDHMADVDEEDEEGATPLHYAARYKRMRLPKTTTQEGEEEHAEDETDETELNQLNLNENNSVIIYLCKVAKADVNKTDSYLCTPLHFAAMRGNELAAYELLQCEANVQAKDNQGMTALHLAASHYEVSVVKMLLEKDAVLLEKDENGLTALHYACCEGSVEIADMLFESAGPGNWVIINKLLTAKDIESSTALHYAVENGHIDLVSLCLEKGADVNTARNNYMTPLHLAAISGDVAIAQLILEKRARIDALDMSQATPLHKAAAFNHVEMVKFLIRNGAQVDKHEMDNFTPLLLAASQGHADTVQVLLEQGANIAHCDKNDKSAIYWTAEEDNLEALKVLLDHPQVRIRDVEKKLIHSSDRYGNTPLHIAAEKGFVKICRALIEAGAEIDWKNEEESTPLHLAAKAGRTMVVREFVKQDKSVINDEDEDSNTPLHLASMFGQNKVCQILLDAGCDIEARNGRLWTPLDCAAEKGWLKTCKVLLEADAPVDARDKNKVTPLLLAASKGHAQVVGLLLDNKASLVHKDTTGENALDKAIEEGHEDVAKVIVNSNKWRDAMMSETVNPKTGYRDTPMRKLIRRMPDVAELVFNKCTSKTEKISQDHPDFEITFDYEFLDDMYSSWLEQADSDNISTSGLSVDIYDEDYKLRDTAKLYTDDSAVLKNNHPLMIMVKNNQEDLLAHPLVTSLLRHKWKSYGRYVYYLNLLIYCIFLTFLTGYVLTHRAPYMYYNGTVERVLECSEVDASTINKDVTWLVFTVIGKYIIMGLAALNLIRELFQIYNAKLAYFGFENLIEWITYITALLVVIDFSPCQQEKGLRTAWQWQIAAVCIFLAWLDLVLFIRKFPRFGIYVVMFTDILRTFVQFFPVFCLFIVAFAFSFYILLQNQFEFRSPIMALVKTTVMMMGEFEYGDVFLGTEDIPNINSPEAFGKKYFYPTISFIIFIIFVVLVAIIIMNLLVGLAVDDIKGVQELAVLKRLAMQVELALDVEALLPRFMKKKFVVRCRKVKPNVRTNFLQRMLNYDWSLSSAAISKMEMEDDELERIEENQENMIQSIKGLRFRMKSLSQQNQRIEAMMKAIIQAQNIDFEEDDAQEEEAYLNLFGI